MTEAKAAITARAYEVGDEGDILDRRDVAGWATMRAILEGRVDDARSGADLVLSLGRHGGDSQAWEPSLLQRYSLVSDWGDEAERYDLLDQCRERAYCFDDLEWRARLTLLLARTGRVDEATVEFDVTVERAVRRHENAAQIDIATNLAEAAWILGDRERAEAVGPQVQRCVAPVVVAGRGWVVKGAASRFRAMVAANGGRTAEAEALFVEATEMHRRMGALPLVAKTLFELGRTLAAAGAAPAQGYLAESAQLAASLGMTSVPSQGRPQMAARPPRRFAGAVNG